MLCSRTGLASTSTQEPTAWLGLWKFDVTCVRGSNAAQGHILVVNGDVRAPLFPETCADGLLDLHGLYVVNGTTTLNGRCAVRGTNATVLLTAPLIIEGAAFSYEVKRISGNCRFKGFLTFSLIERLCSEATTRTSQHNISWHADLLRDVPAGATVSNRAEPCEH